MSLANDSEQTIFDAARQILDPRGRAAYLDAACQGNDPLRQRIEKLLKASERADEFLAGDPLELGQRRETIIVAPLTEGPGTVIGNYKLLEKLGEGGFGVVYMAEQKQPIKRRVALKIIKVGMDTREVVARFEAERQALAMMDHPNIAKVFDAGATQTPHNVAQASPPASFGGVPPPGPTPGGTPGQLAGGDACATLPAGRPYFVMELVRGVKITDYCDEKNLSTRERLDLFTQVCQAVQHAHQKGIIHRDLKPSNILITVNDGVAVPKIIDFGIAKATQMELTEKTVFTRFHQFLGTPAYMSPEQTEITSVDIDTRSDIYSLGVLLYELLTGKTPFDTNELLKAGLDEMRRTIREKEPDRPSTRVSTLRGDELTTTAKRRSLDAPKLAHVLRGDLDWIVMRCLEKDRTRRYETANGLARDIVCYLGNEPIVARPPSKIYRIQKFARRNKLTVVAGVAVVVALSLGLSVATWSLIKERRAGQRAAKEAAKREQVAYFLQEMLKGVGPSVALGRDTTMLREILDKTAKRVSNDLHEQPEVEIELRSTLAATYGELGLYDKMEEIARKTLELARSTFGEESLPVASALSQLGDARLYHRKLEEAETYIREALRIQRKRLGNEHLDVARSLRLLGNIFNNRGVPAEAEGAYREALVICGKHLGEEKVLLEALILNDVAFNLRQLGREAEAEAVARQALEISRNFLGSEHPLAAASLNTVALCAFEQGRFAQAEALYRESLALFQKLFGKDHHTVGSALSGLGASLANQGRLVEAESILREAAATQKRVLGNESTDVAWSLHWLGSVLERQRKFSEAEDCYRDALTIRKKLAADVPTPLLLRLARVLRKQNKPAEAEAFVRDALQNLQPGADAGLKSAQNEIAWILATDRDSKVRNGRGAVTYAEKAAAATGRTNATYLETLAAAYAEAGDFTKAVSVQQEAMTLSLTEEEKKDLASRLKLYQSRLPYRDQD